MPRPCSVCMHPQRHAIDRALMAGAAFRNIAARFGTSTTAVHRHRHAHLNGHCRQSPPPLAPPVESPVPPVLAPDVQQAIAAYQEAMTAYEVLQQTDWLRSSYSPGALLSPAWRKVQARAQRLRELGVDLASLTAR